MIPTVEDLRSARLVHRFGDLFNPPGLTNRLGCVQADVDPVAIRSRSFPPLATGDTSTAALFVGGRLFMSTGSAVAFTWRPDRVEREAEWNGWRIRTITVVPPGETAALVSVEIENASGAERDLDVRLALRGGVTRSTQPWTQPVPPVEYEHDVEVEPSRKGVAFVARASGAVSVQAAWPVPDSAGADALSFRARTRPGERWELRFVELLAAGIDGAFARAYGVLDRAPDVIEAARADWDADLAATFTPGNDRYGGSLPLLETADDDLRRVYLTGAAGVTYFRRESPHSAVGRTYDTLMPRYWQTVTFLWDYSLSAQVHALLDPATMRAHLERWMARDVHTCFGTEWLTGGPAGAWYSVNDYAMTQMIAEYVRWTGDLAWLDAEVPTASGAREPVRRHLERFATNWERFRTPSGLADYGGIGNLLECVSTYVHEVAALNAANVSNLRTAGRLLALLGDEGVAKGMAVAADELVRAVQGLYVEGAGYWHARHPGGRLVPVRHCYDLITVLAAMADDLRPSQREEMADFCRRELQTPTWMHALSCEDADATFSVRPDHQWTGAYPAWPPLAVAGLYRVGRVDQAAAWLHGLARSANQGPFGQAHFAETAIPPDAGGARKAPSDFPYINDWTCSSNGAWVSLVLGSVFGVRAELDGTIGARPQLAGFDAGARLRNLAHRGVLYDVDRDGLHRTGTA